MSTYPAAADSSQAHDDHGHKQGFVDRWFFSTNHKDIGTLYLLFAFTMAIIGASFSVVIRSELTVPGLQLVDPEFFNQMTTMHALVMIFGRSEEHTSELQSLMRISYAVFCLKKKKNKLDNNIQLV